MRKLLLVSMVLFCATIFGQSQYSVILQSGNYELDEKKFDQKLKYKSSEIVDAHFIRLVQFYQVPTQKEQDLLTNSGAKLLGYLPKNTFLIAFPEGYILNDNNVRAVAPFTGPMKLSRKLAMGTIPEYAIKGDKERILVQFYTHLNNHSIKGYANEMMKIAPGQYTLKGSHQLEIIIEPNKWQALAELPFLAYVQEGEDPGEIENYKARSSHRVDAIGLTTDNTYKLDGSGVMISLGDVNSGPMLDSHIDFEGRLTDLGTGNNNSDHGNHTTGTAFGAGNLDPDGTGMAPGADLRYYTYPSNLNNADADYVNHAVRITSSSFSNGCNTYTSFSAQVDKDMYDNRSLVHVFSAGNNNNNNCGYGAGSQWGNITGGHKQGKNVIAVANMTSGDGISGSSSRGPAHDGRVKPDIGGVGTSVYSTLNNNTYGSKSGTSMSCPGIAGTLSLIYQGYKQHNNGTDPDGGLAKALLMNTADDVGNKHVDYIYGYGRVNAYRAMECIEAGNIIIDSVSTTGSNTHTINVPAGTKAVRVMLHWTDKEAFPFAGRALVNDLDMVVTHSNTNTSYLPWVLDPTPNAGALNSVAVRAVDSLNNTEQFTLESPATGDYTIQISGNAVPNGPQRYYVVYSFVTEDLELRAPFGGEVWNPTKNYNIRWQTTDQLGGNSTLQYSLDNGATWTNIVNGLPASLKNYNWNIPNSIASSRVKVRVIRGNDTATSKSFGILRTPTGLTVDWICPDSTQISFNSVPGAIGYVAHRLGTKYMDSVGTSTTTTIRFATANLSAGNWYSVSALDSAGRKSERAIAIRRNGGTLNCVLPNDLEMVQIISPASGNLKDCLGVDSMDVVIRVKNTGQNDLDTIPLNYHLTSGNIVTEYYYPTLQSGDSIDYTFSSTVGLQNGNNDLWAWVSHNADQNGFNDSALSEITVQTGTVYNVYYSQNFDNFNSCNTASNCEQTVCNLIDGWSNSQNLSADDIDFRVNSGTTPSGQTGPNGDHTSGSGKYIYLEASNCFSKWSLAQSPCIQIPASGAELSFWYHMDGVDMGTLHVDILSEGKVDLDVAIISGNQGSAWQEQKVNLNIYAGKIISIRYRGETGVGYRSDICIDDVTVYDPAVAAPTASFSTTPSSAAICIGDTVTYTFTGTGPVDIYNWNFGAGAIPANATTVGPHKVIYNGPGAKVATLNISNAGGLDNASSSAMIQPSSSSAFSHQVTNIMDVQFSDNSSATPTSWFWDFGDGNTSTSQNPNHTYAQGGTYTVKLYAANDCGGDTTTKTVLISGVNLEENEALGVLKVHPNPASSNVFVEWKNKAIDAEIIVTNAMGQEVYRADWKDAIPVDINISNWSNGMYIINVYYNEQHEFIKFIKE